MKQLFLVLGLVFIAHSAFAEEEPITANSNTSGAGFNIDPYQCPAGCSDNATFSGTLLENTIATTTVVQQQTPGTSRTSK